MNKALLALIALLVCVPANAQPVGGPLGDGPPGLRPPRMKEITPVTRAKFDKIVTEMFRDTDQNRDGLVTIEEVGAIVSARRDILIGKRFEKIDSNKDRVLNRDEFFVWQQGLGSLAQSDGAQAIGLIPETIDPEYGDAKEAHLLLGLIEPLSAGLVANANINYDAGLSLDELLAHEHKRFDEADRNRDGAISIHEVHPSEGRLPGDILGLPPVRQPASNP